MSAIKLPVKTSKPRGGWMWMVVDADDKPVCNTLESDEYANQIVLALNWVDDYIGALKEIAASKGKLTSKQVRNVAQQVLARSIQNQPNP